MTIVIEKSPTGRILGLRKHLKGLTRQHVLDVLNIFSLETAAPFGFIDSTDFDLIHEGKPYPPKAVFGLAAQNIIGRPLTADEFSGGVGSPCFVILQNLGFSIQPKQAFTKTRPTNLDGLVRYQSYTRKEICQIFEPGTTFVPQAGRWGISGIVETPKDSGNFVFLVTLGEPREGNPYQDELTEDGYLLWESQTRHDFSSLAIKKLLAHDPQQHNIYLFIRSGGNKPYVYLGLLEYFSHDPNTVEPVHFIWRLLSWECTGSDLQELGLIYRKPLDPAYSPLKLEVNEKGIEKVDPPVSLTGADATIKGKRKAIKKSTTEVDWAAKDENNRKLGLFGEKLILQYEKDSLLKAGCSVLASQIKHVALYDASAGYDILSFQPDGTTKHIEVKTTQGGASTPFFLSINELLVSKEKESTYWICRVYDAGDATKQPKFYELQGAVDSSCHLNAINFRAYPQNPVDE